MIMGRHFFQLRKVARETAADRIGEIAPNDPRGIGQSIGKARWNANSAECAPIRRRWPRQQRLWRTRAFRCAWSCRCRETASAFPSLPRTISRAIALAIRVKRPVACAGGNHDLAGAEVGGGDAAAAALRAVVAGSAPVQRLGQNGEARWNAGDVELVAGLLDDGLSAARLWRRLETRRRERWARSPSSRRRRYTIRLCHSKARALHR